MNRISVTGTCGSGKSTVGRAVAELLTLPYVELDSLHWIGPDWTQPSAAELRDRVEAAMGAAPGGWVIDGNYHGKLGTLVLERADTAVWLDLPLSLCLRRIWTRTWRRILLRERLWNGNRESFRTAFLARDSLFLWAIRSHRRRRRTFPAVLAGLRHLEVVQLRSPREVERWLAQLDGDASK